MKLKHIYFISALACAISLTGQALHAGDTEIVIQAQEPLHGKHQFVACKQSIFVGHIEYSRAKHTITWLWVNEDYRGNGIGKELFTAAINDLRPLCSQVTWLSTQDAIPFYQAMGATISERRKEDPAHLTRMSINTYSYLFVIML